MFHEKLSFLLIILVVGFSACTKEPVKIGFSAALSGRLSQLGVSSREAVLIAIEVQNKNGGINGNEIQLIIVDDKSIPEIGIIEIKKLVDGGAVAIIAPLTSNILSAVQSVVDIDSIVISPTISTLLLFGMDANFVRVIPTTDEQGRIVSELVVKDDIRTTEIIHDSSNSQYTAEVQKAFIKESEARGGSISELISFDGTPKPDSIQIAKQIINSGIPESPISQPSENMMVRNLKYLG